MSEWSKEDGCNPENRWFKSNQRVSFIFCIFASLKLNIMRKEKRKTIPKPRLKSRSEYDFLKYIRVVFKWATENNPTLNRPQIELLLYLYSLGAFSKKEFTDYHKTISLYQQKTLDYFIKEGWVKVWRVRKGKEHALYNLTRKAKTLCYRMHSISCGVEEIPESAVYNNLEKKGSKRINGYYMDIIKKMNSDRA